jgi:hypothetical protein
MWTYLCGLDFGIVDQNAVCVLGWRRQDPCVYVVSCYRMTAIPSELAAEVRRLETTYKFVRIIGDVGGMGKAFAEEMRRRPPAIPVEPAEKHNKVGYIALFNDALRTGRIKVVRSACADLLQEWAELPWAENRMKEAEGFNNHAADACLYAWRAANAFLEKYPEPQAVEGTAEYWEKREREMEKAAVKAFRQRR